MFNAFFRQAKIISDFRRVLLKTEKGLMPPKRTDKKLGATKRAFI